MTSTLSHQQMATVETESALENPAQSLKSRLGDQLDEIAVFALVAVVIFYIAAASCWFIW
jgi:hypothetical protein